ncbi:MAG: hypothetical protein M8350_02690 [Methanosarcinaceae archaeon]|nr:hypothetical protein [Methanosarcinaceae archaeon]
MNRECTPECVAYSEDEAVSIGAENIGLKDMHCVRFLAGLANLMETQYQIDFDDLEDEYDL